MRLLLASKSSARRRMLEAARVPFEVVDADVDEEAAKARFPGLGAEGLALCLAEVKALAARSRDQALILGADQTLELADGTTLSKPASPAEAGEQLRSMSAACHKLYSAAAIAENGEIVWRASASVTMTVRALSDSFIKNYVAAEFEHIRWSVGGYRIEGPGVQLFERIDGDHFTILGLPLLRLLQYLRERGVLAS